MSFFYAEKEGQRAGGASLKKTLRAAIKLRDDIIVIEIDNTIVKQADIRDGTIFQQKLTPDGYLVFKRIEQEKNSSSPRM
jgi:hypothetical protein